MWVAREISSSQGILLFTQVGCTQSNGGQQEEKSQKLTYSPGANQAQIPVKIQLTHQLYQSLRSLVKS